MNDDKAFLTYLISSLDGVYPKDWLLLFRHFQSLSAIFKQSLQELNTVLKSSQKAQKITALQKNLVFHEKEFAKLLKKEIHCLNYFDADYPVSLKNISSPPICLFYKGDISLLNQNKLLAVVGTRQITDYGKKVVATLVPKLCEAGLIIVSGLAFGVDACAHEASLKFSQKSVAVLAKGVDEASPKWNQSLFEQIMTTGCVMSEFPFAKEIRPYHFPRRNRIVSGLCQGVLVVEAPVKSGALITAYAALEQNRNVYAVPGGVFQKMSQGCLKLIQEGAKVVTSVDDILEDFVVEASPKVMQKELPILSGVEQKIYDFCLEGPKSQFQIYDQLPYSSSEISAALTKLELLGTITKSSTGDFTCQV